MKIGAVIPALLALASVIGAGGAQDALVLSDVSVVDVQRGTVQPHMLVRVMDGRITSVQPMPRAAFRSAGTIVDGRGKFLIPGLWDSHVHLTKLGPGALSAFLANGVTSVRDMGSDLEEVAGWRRQIEAGSRPGPRIKTAGQILESRANVERMKREGTVEPVDRIRIPISTPEEAEAAVSRLVAGGADLIKVRTVANEGTLRAIAAAARAHGRKWAGHPVAVPDVLIDTAIGSVEHMLAFPPLSAPPAARAALFARMRDAHVAFGTSVFNFEGSIEVPYAAAVARLSTDPLRVYVSPYLMSDWREQLEERKGADGDRMLAAYRAAMPGLRRDMQEMHAAGVSFLAGSDAAVVFRYAGFGLHEELEALVRAVGLAPVDALRAATINPATFFSLERELGAIEPGYVADMVMLDGNPIEDIRSTRRVAGVIRGGQWLDRRALDALLERAKGEAHQ